MKRYNKNLGDFGEAAAGEYLKNCGYEVICRNFYVKGGEIDIIAFDGDTLVFIEVKTRSSEKFGFPSEAVNKKKIIHMRSAAEAFLISNPMDKEIRFDIIEVYAQITDGNPQLSEINHIKEIIID